MIKQLEKRISELEKQLATLEKIKKKTVGLGFAKMKCRELIATYKDCIKEAKLMLEI
jgi:DNA-directed RNA polymerase subunit N (RpoN/RPB10)|tara:strand:- start:1098 stop:1268 length:171 start_codon:yes stop_codon:yes gene_type:complete